MRSRTQALSELRGMLHDLFVARADGVHTPRMARTQGYVDGYMRALIESGHATKAELLEIVALERTRVGGPATRELALETAAEIAAA